MRAIVTVTFDVEIDLDELENYLPEVDPELPPEQLAAAMVKFDCDTFPETREDADCTYAFKEWVEE